MRGSFLKSVSSRSAWVRLVLMITLSAASLPALAKTYPGVDAQVPFKFKIGDRTFPAGRYQLIIVGANLLAVRDAHAHTVASLVTRPVDNGEPAPVNKLVFKLEHKHNRLAQVWIANGSRPLQILGEQVAMRPSGPLPERVPDFVANSLFERQTSPGMKH